MRQKNMKMSFDRESERKDVNQYLKKVYKIGLRDFEFDLRNIKVFFDLVKLKKRKVQYQAKIRGLEVYKRKVVAKIIEFLHNADLWKEIKEVNSGKNVSTDEGIASYIKRNFGLTPYFERIDANIRFYKRAIILLDGYRVETEEKRKRIRYPTLISLVWFYSMFRGKATNTQKFRDIAKLLDWLSANKPKLMNELFGEQVSLDDPAVKANYDRYIKNPTRNREVYRDIAMSIHCERFSPVD